MSDLNRKASSSASECDPMEDEKKRKRLISNRDSARRARSRKRQQYQDICAEMAHLTIANSRLRAKIDETTEQYMMDTAKKDVLSARIVELTERLSSLNDIIKTSGFAVDAAQMTDPSLK